MLKLSDQEKQDVIRYLEADEPRQETPSGSPSSGGEQLAFFSTDARGRQLKGWTNKLIWGDNKLILSSLKNGPLREEIEAQGGLKLIYIDPPFDVGADFSMDVEVGGNPPVSPLVRGDEPYPRTGESGLSGGDRSDPPDKGARGVLPAKSRRSPKNPTSWKRSPTATPGERARTRSLP